MPRNSQRRRALRASQRRPLPPSPLLPRHASLCTNSSAILWGQDYQGSDIVKGGVSAGSAKDCCSKCQAKEGCNFWTYGNSGNRKGTCWLKKDSIGRQVQSNRDAGKVCRSPKDCPPVNDKGICQDCQKAENILLGQDYQGADLIKGGVTASSSSDCCSKCRANDQCLYWTYGKSGDKKGTCWLKKSQAGRQYSSDRDAGKVCGRMPTKAVASGRRCAGWTPTSGKFKGQGGSCAKWGSSYDWCYVAKDYAGPGHEFILPSNEYPNMYYMPCKVDSSTSSPGSSPVASPAVASPAAPTCKSCAISSAILWGHDYQGSDIVKGGVSAGSAKDCCSKCRAKEGCSYWAYGNSGNRKGTCWLKKDSIGRQLQSNRDAGKVCRSPKDCPPVAMTMAFARTARRQRTFCEARTTRALTSSRAEWQRRAHPTAARSAVRTTSACTGRTANLETRRGHAG